MSCQISIKIGLLWMMIDNMVIQAKTWGPLIEDKNICNGTEITMVMKKLEHSCGYTEEMALLLFGSAYIKERKELARLGITFPRSDNPKWDKKKICINITHEYPSFYYIYFINGRKLGEMDVPAALRQGQVQPGCGAIPADGGLEMEVAPAQQEVVEVAEAAGEQLQHVQQVEEMAVQEEPQQNQVPGALAEFPAPVMVHFMDDNEIIIKSKNNKKWRDDCIPEGKTKVLGVRQRTAEKVIPVGCIGDYGGTLGKGETKVQLIVLAGPGGAKHNFTTQISCIYGREVHETLKHTIMGPVNDCFERLKNSHVLLLTWGNQCDFVIIPRTVQAANVTYSRIHAYQLRASWLGGSEVFSREDIPDPNDCDKQCVKFKPYINGDLAFQFCIQGRAGFESKRCLTCNAKYSQWQPARYCGQILDMKEHREQWVELEDMNENANNDSDVDEAEFIDDYVRNADGQVGVTVMDVLLPALSIACYLPPVLHLMLGIGNDLIKRVKVFIQSRLERDNSTAMYRGFHETLVKHNIDMHKHFPYALVGNDVRNMLDNYNVICNDLSTLFHKPQLRKDDVDDAVVDTFIGNLCKILQVFGAVCSLMSHNEPLTAELLEGFPSLCQCTAAMWRAYFPDCGITPKMHFVEEHLWRFMLLYGVLGDKSEAEGERLHHWTNEQWRILAPLQSYKDIKKVMLDREAQAELPAIKRAVQEMEDGTRKVFSPQVQAARDQRAADTSALKLEKISSAVIAANAFLHPVHLDLNV